MVSVLHGITTFCLRAIFRSKREWHSNHLSFTFSPQSSAHTEDVQNNTPNSSLPLPLMAFILPVKLKEGNYHLWKSQLQIFLTANGLETFIDGTRTRSARYLNSLETVVNPQYKQCVCLDCQVMSLIYSSLSAEP